MSKYSHDDRQQDPALAVAPTRGIVTSRLRKLCDCTRALALITSDGPQEWLDDAAFEIAQALDAKVGVSLMLGRWDTERRRWRLTASAQYTNGFENLVRCGAVLLERWPDDEYSIAAGHASYPLKTSVGRLADLVTPQVWERCAYRRLRESQNLAGAARWIGLTARQTDPEAVLIQVEDPHRRGGPSDSVLEELAALAPQLLAAYEEAFLVPEMRRLSALDRLTPAQQRIARLLLAGYSQVDIAEKINRKYHTVRGHVKGIYDRLQVHSRDEFAQALGCPSPEIDVSIDNGEPVP